MGRGKWGVGRSGDGKGVEIGVKDGKGRAGEDGKAMGRP